MTNTHETDNLNVQQINDAVERAEFKKREQTANDNLSLILNPLNKYKRTQEEILKDINERATK